MKKILSIALSVSMLCSMSFGSFANSVDSPDTNVSEKICGKKYSDTETSERLQSNTTSNLSGNVTINQGEDTVINSEVVDGTQKVVIELRGHFYPFTNGYYKDNTMVGEFTTLDKNFEVISVRIDKNASNKKMNVVSTFNDGSTLLTVKVKNIATNENYLLQSNLNNQEYKKMLNQSKRNHDKYMNVAKDEREYMDKIAKLDLGKSVMTQSSHSEQVEKVETSDKVASQAPAMTMMVTGTKTSIGNFSYAELNRFITDLKNSGYNGININNYNISESFFTRLGWDDSCNTSTLPFYTADKYTSVDTNNIYYTRLSMIDVIHTNTWTTNTTNAYLEFQYKSGVMIEYIPGSGRAKLYLDNYGLKYSTKMCLTKLNGNTNNIFINRSLYGNIASNSYNITGLIALIPQMQYITALWDAFTTSETGRFNSGVESFGSTPSEQISRWGKVVRGICLDAGSEYIYTTPQRFGLSGAIKWSYSASYTWYYNWTCWTY